MGGVCSITERTESHKGWSNSRPKNARHFTGNVDTPENSLNEQEIRKLLLEAFQVDLLFHSLYGISIHLSADCEFE